MHFIEIDSAEQLSVQVAFGRPTFELDHESSLVDSVAVAADAASIVEQRLY